MSLSEVMEGATRPTGMDQLTWLMPFPPTNSPIWVYASITAVKKLGTIRESAGSWAMTDITRASGGNYNITLMERWQGAVFQGLGVFNQIQDVPQLWNPIAAATPVIAMPNWSTNPEGANSRVKVLRPYKNFLISLGIKNSSSGAEYPYRLRWSHPAPPGESPSSWEVANPANDAGETDLAETSDVLVDGLTLGDTFMVYKELTTWGLQYVGGRNIMRVWKVLAESGLLSQDCVSAFPGGHFVATRNDLIVHGGGENSSQSVIKNKLRHWLNVNLNYSYKYNCFTVAYAHEQEIWFCFPTIGSIYANMAIVFHWDTGICSVQDLPLTPFIATGGVADVAGLDDWG